jgi:hypothetical protein
MEEFIDINLVGLDITLTRQSNTAPGLRHMFLKLSQIPSSAWVEIFMAERALPRHMMWRDAWIEGDAIVVDCVPEEIQQHHLADLKQDVANSNKKYRDFLRRDHGEKQRRQQAEEAEKKRLEEIRRKLDFS